MDLNTWYFARLHLHYFRKCKAEWKSNHRWLQKCTGACTYSSWA